MDISKLSEWLKLSPRYLLPISLITGFLLFAPSEILNKFGLIAFTNQYRPYFGIIFLLSTALVLVDLLLKFFLWVRHRGVWSTNLRMARKRLHNLTLDEKKLLRKYIFGKTKSQYLPMLSGIVNGLEAEGIIYRAANIGDPHGWAYNIQPWAWAYLNQHPELLTIDEEYEGPFNI